MSKQQEFLAFNINKEGNEVHKKLWEICEGWILNLKLCVNKVYFSLLLNLFKYAQHCSKILIFDFFFSDVALSLSCLD